MATSSIGPMITDSRSALRQIFEADHDGDRKFNAWVRGLAHIRQNFDIRQLPRPRPDLNWRIAIQCAILDRDASREAYALTCCLPLPLRCIVSEYVRRTKREVDRITITDWVNKCVDTPITCMKLISGSYPVKYIMSLIPHLRIAPLRFLLGRGFRVEYDGYEITYPMTSQ
jgi:hypothetical protein